MLKEDIKSAFDNSFIKKYSMRACYPDWLCCVSRCVVCWWMESIPAVASTSSSTRPVTAVRPALSASRVRSRTWWDRRARASFQPTFKSLWWFRLTVGNGIKSKLLFPTNHFISRNTQRHNYTTEWRAPVCKRAVVSQSVAVFDLSVKLVSYSKGPAAVT